MEYFRYHALPSHSKIQRKMAPSAAAAVGRRRSARNATAAAASSPATATAAGGSASGGVAGRKHLRQPVVDDDVLEEILAYVKKRRSRVVSADEKLDILLLQAKLRYNHYTQTQAPVKKPAPSVEEAGGKQMARKRREFNGANATERVAELLNRKKDLVAKVWADYWNDVEVASVAKPAANYAKKSTLVPNTHAVVKSVHAFVRERRLKGMRVIARDVTDHLAAAGFIEVNRASRRAMQSTVRSVNRFLNRIGYTRGAKEGIRSYTLRDENSLERDDFLVKMTTLLNQQSDGGKRIVYVGESYLFEKYARDDSSVFDPNDEQDVLMVRGATTEEIASMERNGKRFCFISAIVDADHSIPDDERSESDQAHLLQDALVIFEGEKKQTKDFRDMFYHRALVNWMEALFAALSVRGIENAVIVMENSKLHRELPSGTPTESTTKAQMQNACEEYGIPFDSSSELRSMLWEKLKRHIEDHVKPVVCDLAAEHGHEVVFSPLAHSELQPIENVYAAIKGEVGRQYTPDSTPDDVQTRLEQAFADLSSETVQRCIDEANANLADLMAHVEQLDDMVLTSKKVDLDEEDGDDVNSGGDATEGGEDEEEDDYEGEEEDDEEEVEDDDEEEPEPDRADSSKE